MVALEKIYDVFYSSINIDLSKHPELDVTVNNNLVFTYLDSALYEYEENLNTALTVDSGHTQINEDIPNPHIRLLGKLIYKNFLERELNSALRIANQFNKRSELNVIGVSAKIVALRECLQRVQTELGRSFTRNIMKNVGKGQ